MLDRAVLIHLKLIDLPRQAAARKVLDDDTLRFANSCLRLNEILLIGGSPRVLLFADHPKEVPCRQSLLTDQWRLAACGPNGCTARATQKSIFNLGVNCV